MSSVKYDNPSIKVVWEDTPENFTNERLARVKSVARPIYQITIGKNSENQTL